MWKRASSREIRCPMEHSKTRLLTRDIASIREVGREVTSELLSQTTPTPFSFIGSRGSDHRHTSWSADPHNPVHDHDTSRRSNAPMIHACLLFPMHSFLHVSHLYVLLSSLRLTWLADPALVTSVYPNRMQYTPRVLQEASLLDGVDVGVRGNGRRFSKTSSYPPCRCYAFIFFYPYFLTTSSSPLFLMIHSFHMTHHTPTPSYKSIPRSLSPLFPLHHIGLPRLENISYLWQNNVVKDSSWPLSSLVYITADMPCKVLSFVILGIPLPYRTPVF